MGFRRRPGRRHVEGWARGDSRGRLPMADRRSDSEDFVYCGVQTAKGRSYCAGHCRMAYKPPNSRVWDGERYVALESMRPPEAATRGLISSETDGGARPRERQAFRAGAIFLSSSTRRLRARWSFPKGSRPAFLGSSIMSNASFSRPLGTAMVGGAIAMATLEVLVPKECSQRRRRAGGPEDGPELARQRSHRPGLAGRREDHRRDQGPVLRPRARPMERASPLSDFSRRHSTRSATSSRASPSRGASEASLPQTGTSHPRLWLTSRQP